MIATITDLAALISQLEQEAARQTNRQRAELAALGALASRLSMLSRPPADRLPMARPIVKAASVCATLSCSRQSVATGRDGLPICDECHERIEQCPNVPTA